MNTHPHIQQLIEFWFGISVCLGLAGIFNIPVQLMFAQSRRWQLTDPKLLMHHNAPAHWLLNWICYTFYGVLLPLFYFVNFRQRHRFNIWELGERTNSAWTMALGAVLVCWMTSHIVEAVLRRGSIRFRRNPVNIVAGVAAVGLCLWFHIMTIPPMVKDAAHQAGSNILEYYGMMAIGVVYPQSFFFGATLVYLSVLLEVLKRPVAVEDGTGVAEEREAGGRRMRKAAIVAALFVLTMFAPFWLSLPKVPHRQAMALLAENREKIVNVARDAQLDPLLLAGIIYVAHTRDQPRITGGLIDRFGFQLVEGGDFNRISDELMINPSVGLCQMKLTTMKITHEILPNQSSKPMYLYYIRYNIGNTVQFQEGLKADRNRRRDAGVDYFADRIPVKINANYTMLDDEELSLLFAAAMLKALEMQWEQAGFPISDRPEILATLYNLGYERSEPKAAPRANDFGRRVLKFMESKEAHAWMGEGKA